MQWRIAWATSSLTFRGKIIPLRLVKLKNETLREDQDVIEETQKRSVQVWFIVVMAFIGQNYASMF